MNGVEASPNRTFHQVGGRDLQKLPVMTKIFNRILTPLYGDQSKALAQISSGTDRMSFLLYEGESPVGVLVFKSILSDEFKEYGVEKSIEIKSLFVDNSVQNSGRGLGATLVNKLFQEVQKLHLHHLGIHVTVSETKQESVLFFRKKGFEITHEWQDRYVKGVKEYLLYYSERKDENLFYANRIEGASKDSTSRMAGPSSSSSSSSTIGLIRVIANAHLDDIHTLIKLSDNTFVSGSKDNCLYKWSPEGELKATVHEVEPWQRNESNWITSAAVINDKYWVSGDRSGSVNLWNTNGSHKRSLHLKLPKYDSSHMLDFNKYRINCLSVGSDPSNPTLFAGFPSSFDEYNFIEGRTISTTKAHDRDWIYAVHPLSGEKALTVTGCKIDLWTKKESSWNREKTVFKEQPRYVVKTNKKTRHLRPFISSLTPLDDGSRHFGLSLFDGTVRVLDIEKGEESFTAKEHSDLVWQIEKITADLFASCSSDQTIKLWDRRQQASVTTLADHIGPVTSLLSFDADTLIAGSCGKEAFTKNEGAEIRFYDLRGLSSA